MSGRPTTDRLGTNRSASRSASLRRRNALHQSRLLRHEACEKRELLAIAATDNAFSGLFGANVSGNVKSNDLVLTPTTSSTLLVSNPASGTLTSSLTAAGAFTYTPNVGFVGTDSFQYLLVDSTEERLNPQSGDAGVTDLLGSAVAVSGEWAVVGMISDDAAGIDNGAAYVYQWNGTAWVFSTKLLPDLSPSGAVAQFGGSVAIDGGRIVVGAFLDDTSAVDSGSAYVFEFDGLVWQRKARLTSNAPVASEWFGRSVAVAGDEILVGAVNAGVGVTGAVYAFQYDATTQNYVQSQILLATAGATGDFFGKSVALEGNRAVVGANGDNDGATADTGSAFVFEKNSAGLWIQQVQLLATDRATDDQFGWSVDLSGDRVVVGARHANQPGKADAGAAYAFQKVGASWIQTKKLSPTDLNASSYFGFAVAIDGDTIVSGAYGADVNGFTDIGATYVYQWLNADWAQTHRLISGINQSAVSGGYAVAAIDGDTVLSGLPYADTTVANSGAISFFHLYRDLGTVNIRVLPSGQTLAATDDHLFVVEDGSLAGQNVSANDLGSGTGSYVARTPLNGNLSSFANGVFSYIPNTNFVGDDSFTYTLEALTEKKKSAATPSGPTHQANALFGYSVALDGDTAVIGAPYEDNGAAADVGAIYIYQWTGQDWLPVQKVWGESSGDLFGSDVAVQGNRILVGAFLQGTDDRGAAYVLEHDGLNWTQSAASAIKLSATTPSASDWFGRSVDLAGDLIVVGAPLDDIGSMTNAGSAYLFSWDGNSWGSGTLLQGFAADHTAFDQAGQSVAIAGDTIVVGVPFDDTATADVGSALIFQGVGANWTQQARLLAPSGANLDRYGWSVDVSGDNIVVGAYFRNVGAAADAGSAYLYKRTAGIWGTTAIQTLSPTTPDQNDYFGVDVSLEGDTLVVGAYQDDDAGVNAGAVYIYRYDGSSFVQRHKKTSGIPTASAQGGWGVGAVWGDQVLMGIPYDGQQASAAGAASFFEFQNGTVLVNVLSGSNDSPAAVGSGTIVLPAVQEDAVDTVLMLANYFSDPDLANGDLLTYSITSNTNAVVIKPSFVGNALVLDYLDDQNTASAVNITVRATDQAGLYIERTFSVPSVAAVDDKAAIANMITPPAVRVGDLIILSATGVADVDGSVTGVTFYRDSDNDGVLSASEKATHKLGVGTKDANGYWNLSNISTAGFAAGQTTYFAVAATGAVEGDAATVSQRIFQAGPTIVPIEDQSVVQGRRFISKFAASDPGGAAINYSYLSTPTLPGGAVFNSATGQLDWYASSTGSFTITVTATSANGSAQDTFTLISKTPGIAPELVSINDLPPPDSTLLVDSPWPGASTNLDSNNSDPEGNYVDFSLVFSDPDGPPSGISVKKGSRFSLPSGLSSELTNGVFRVKGVVSSPDNLPIPEGHNLHLIASDGDGNEKEVVIPFYVAGWLHISGQGKAGTPNYAYVADDYLEIDKASGQVDLDVSEGDSLWDGKLMVNGLDVSQGGPGDAYAQLLLGGSAKFGSQVNVNNDGTIGFKASEQAKYEGYDQFEYSYQISGDAWVPYSTNKAQVTVVLYEHQPDECGCGEGGVSEDLGNGGSVSIGGNSGGLRLSQNAGDGGELGAVILVYDSVADGRPLVNLDTRLSQDVLEDPLQPDWILADVPQKLDLTVTIDAGSPQQNVGTQYYDATGLLPGDAVSFSYLPDGLPAGNLSTGRHKVNVQLNAEALDYRSFEFQQPVVNRNGSEFGPSWSLQGLDRIYLDTTSGDSGVLLVASSNETFWFPESSPGAYASAANDGAERKLAKVDVGGAKYEYVLTDLEGNRAIFADGTVTNDPAQGMLKRRVDRFGNTTTYSYLDKDLDGKKDEIVSISDYAGRSITFNYGSGAYAGRVVEIKDILGKSTFLGEDLANGFSYIQGPDPDGTGPGLAAFSKFTLQAVGGINAITAVRSGEGLYTQVAAPKDRVYSVSFNGANRAQRLLGAKGEVLGDVTAAATQGLPELLSNLGTTAGNRLPLARGDGKSWERTSRVVDALGNAVTSLRDSRGLVTRSMDALGNVTEYQRDEVGNVLGMSSPSTVAALDATVDDGDAAGWNQSGVWNILGGAGQAGDYRHAAQFAGANLATAQWQFTELSNQTQYELFASWTPNVANTSDATYKIYDNVSGSGAPIQTSTVIQSAPPIHGDVLGPGWQSLGKIRPTQSTLTVLLDNQFQTGARVVADAIRIVETRPEEVSIYDSLHNLIERRASNGLVTKWTYEPTFNRVATMVEDAVPGGLNKTTLYVYFPNGNLMEERQIIGLDDSSSSEADDLVTSYTYTTATTNVPAGRLLSTTDSLGRRTEYTYYTTQVDAGRVQRVTSAAHTGDVAVVQFKYDAYGNVIEETDPLGRVMKYTFDIDGNRLTEENAALDPDGAGPLKGPTSSFVYEFGRMVKSTDPLGRVTEYQYNDRGLLMKSIMPDPDGGGPATRPESRNFYDLENRLSFTVDPLGRKTSYEYDAVGRVTKVFTPDPDGSGALYTSSVTENFYDANGQLIQVKDPRGNSTTFEYDIEGRQTKVIQPIPQVGQSNPISTTVYDRLGRVISTTDPLGNSTAFEYDVLGRQIKTLLPYPNGTPTTIDDGDAGYSVVSGSWSTSGAGGFNGDYRWTSGVSGASTAVVQWQFTGLDPLKKYEVIGTWLKHASTTTSATYQLFDGNGTGVAQSSKTVNQTAAPTGHSLLGAGWQSLGVVTLSQGTLSVRLGNGGANGNVVADAIRIVEARPELSTSYDKLGNVLTSTDPGGLITSYEYDFQNRLTKTIVAPAVVGGVSAVSSVVYNRAGQVISSTDPLGRVTRYVYDAGGRQSQVSLPDPDWDGPELGTVSTTHYDFASRGLGSTDTLGRTNVGVLDRLNRSVASINSNGEVTSYTFDLAGNRLTLKDPAGNTTSWVYDGLNRLSTETNQLGFTRQFFYDANSNLTKKLDRLGRRIEYTLDNLNRTTAENWYATAVSTTVLNTLQFTYDLASRMLSAKDLDVDGGGGDLAVAEYSFTPDGLGRNTSITTTLAGLGSTVTATQAFDSRGNRTSLDVAVGGTSNFSNVYTYDQWSRTTQITQTGSTVNTKRAKYTYNVGSEVTKLERFGSTDASVSAAATEMRYDQLGRLAGILHVQPGASSKTQLARYDMAYDAANRITRIDSSVDEASLYTYDRADQLKAANHTFENNEAYSYDSNGNRTNTGYVNTANNQLQSDGKFTYTYDNEGNRKTRTEISTGRFEEYTWDHHNRLTKVTFKTSFTGSTVKVIDYRYDASDMKVAEFVDATAPFDMANASAKWFIYDGGNVVLDFVDTDVSTGPVGAVSRRYFQGPGVDQLLAQENVISGGNQTLWVLPDHLGSTRDLVDNTGKVQAHYQFDSFGKILDGRENVTRYQFQGREHDSHTDYNYHRARWYDPVSGKWISEDPIGFAAGDPNLSRMVGNNVLNATDPSGLFKDWYVRSRSKSSEGELTLGILGKSMSADETDNGVWLAMSAALGHDAFQSSTYGDIFGRLKAPLEKQMQGQCEIRVALIGYSWGGGRAVSLVRQVYDFIKSYGQQDRTPHIYLFLIDAIQYGTANAGFPVTRGPDAPLAQFFNYYQTKDAPDWIEAHGASIEGAVNYDLSSQLFPDPSIYKRRMAHLVIDEAAAGSIADKLHEWGFAD